jgi:hypothetical protein
MREDIQNNSTDSTTKRPNSPPLKKAGSCFILMQLDDFGYDISLPETASTDDPISLFTLYYAPEIIDQLVKYTNQYQREP